MVKNQGKSVNVLPPVNCVETEAAVAIQRKLLELIYILFKSRKPFDQNLFMQLMTIELTAAKIKKEVDEIQTTSFTV